MNAIRLWHSLGFPLFEYDAELLEWIVRHKTQMTSENIYKVKPILLPVAHIRAAMEYFIDNVNDSPQYESMKSAIDRDLDETRRLYEAKFGIRSANEGESLGKQPETP